MADQDDLYLENLNEFVNDENKIVSEKKILCCLDLSFMKYGKCSLPQIYSISLLLQFFQNQRLLPSIYLHCNCPAHSISSYGSDFLEEIN